MKIADCHKCGTKGGTTLNRFTGDGYFAYCPKCLQFGPTVEGVTREDAIKEWNEVNKDVDGAIKTVEGK